MKPRTIPGRVVLAVAVLSGVWTSGVSRADTGDDDHVASKVVAAATKQWEYRDMQDRYREAAEMARDLLQMRTFKADLVLEVRQMNATIATFPAIRRWWLATHHAFLQQKVAKDQQIATLDRQMQELDLRQQRAYEVEMQRAEGKLRRRPIRREAILSELDRLEKERDEAVRDVKVAIDGVARSAKISRRDAWDRARKKLDGFAPRPDLPADTLVAFMKEFNRLPWLNLVDDFGEADSRTKPRSGGKRHSARDQALGRSDASRAVGSSTRVDQAKISLLRTISASLQGLAPDDAGHVAEAIRAMSSAIDQLGGSAGPMRTTMGSASPEIGRVKAQDILRDAQFKLRNLYRQLGGSGGSPRRKEARAAIAQAIEHLEKALARS